MCVGLPKAAEHLLLAALFFVSFLDKQKKENRVTKGGQIANSKSTPFKKSLRSKYFPRQRGQCTKNKRVHKDGTRSM